MQSTLRIVGQMSPCRAYGTLMLEVSRHYGEEAETHLEANEVDFPPKFW
jgi:hypothetical protein